MIRLRLKLTVLALAALLLTAIGPKVYGQSDSDSEFTPSAPIANALAKLNRNSSDPWTVKWNPSTGFPARLNGRTRKAYKGSIDEIGAEFIAEYRPLFTGLAPKDDPGDITFSVDPGMPIAKGMQMIMLPQRYKGLRIYQTAVSVRVDADGHVIAVSGNPLRIENLSIKPKLTSDQILAILRDVIHPDSLGRITRNELIIHRSDPPTLAYRISATTWRGKNSGSGDFVVDANTGQIRIPDEEFLRRRAGDPEEIDRIDQ